MCTHETLLDHHQVRANNLNHDRRTHTRQGFVCASHRWCIITNESLFSGSPSSIGTAQQHGKCCTSLYDAFVLSRASLIKRRNKPVATCASPHPRTPLPVPRHAFLSHFLFAFPDPVQVLPQFRGYPFRTRRIAVGHKSLACGRAGASTGYAILLLRCRPSAILASLRIQTYR